MSNRITYKLDWHGAQVYQQVEGAVVRGLTQWGLALETPAKGPLVLGHGMLTATYKRSIHSAGPSYNFAGDDMQPSYDAPERGGTGGEAEVQGSKVISMFGSGLHYAKYVEDRYGTIEAARSQMLEQLPKFLERAAHEAGLK